MPSFRPILSKPYTYLIVALVVACIGSMLYLPGAGSALLYVLLLILVLSMVTSHRKMTQQPLPFSFWLPLLLVSGWLVLATLLTQLMHGSWHPTGLERALRALCVVPVLYLFCLMPQALMRHVQWGFMLVTLSGAWGLIFPIAVFPDGLQRPNTAAYTLYNTVGYANIVMLFACLTLASLGWRCTRFIRTEVALKLVVPLIGFYGVLQSQTRSSMLVIPAFLLIAWLAKRPKNKRSMAIFVAAAIAVVALLGSSSIVQDRVGIAYAEIKECRVAPQADTSICIRFQLLRAAKTMFQENPVFGVGDGPLFRAAMLEMGEREVVSKFVAKNWGETHNDVSFVAANYGLFGLIPFLLCYFVVPGWLLLRNLAAQNRTQQIAAIMGLLVVSGFLTFGLTEAMYRSMRTVSVYFVLVAFFIAMSRPQPTSAQGK